MKDRTILKSKEGCYLEFLTSEMVKLLESTKQDSRRKKWWKYASFRNHWSSTSSLQYCQK